MRQLLRMFPPAKSPTYSALLVTFLSLFTSAGCSSNSDEVISDRQAVLRIAVTTSTRDSGLLEVLNPVFEEQQGVRVDVIAVGSGAALKLGEAGEVDVVLVHSRDAEEAFMESSHGIRREEVMYNSFELLGPVADPAGIASLLPTAALQKIANDEQRFVSRGDNSGTHQREMKLWSAGDGRPQWSEYVESGLGMGAALTMANQMEAYILSDRGTYLKFKEKIDLIPLITSAENLQNRYGIIVVNPQKHSSINSKLAQRFVDFIISPKAQRLIRDYKIDGEPLFFPLHLSDLN